MTDIIAISVFYEFAALLVLAAGVGLVGLALRQPLIVSFIAVGILAGPSALGIARSSEYIQLFAELGVAVLLFLVGLKLDLKLIRTLGLVSLTTGLGQVIFTSVIGFLICLVLGLDALTSLYVAVALTFSSTIIVVKLLSDKKEIDSLHGQIALGFLIVQDLVVVLAMVALSALGIGVSTDAPLLEVAMTLVSGAALLGVVGLFIRYLAEPLVRRVARAPELLVCFVIGWAALLAALGDYLGLGKELGGLLAGVSLASTQFRESIATRMAPLRDFLVLFFFIGLGARLDLGLFDQELVSAILLSLFVLIGNPLIVLIIMGLMGYRKRTGFLAGLTVAQISEFSLIFMAMGLSIGHVDEQALGLVTLVGLITIGLSTYMITYSHRLYDWLEPLLGPFERAVPHREDREAGFGKWQKFDVLLFGLGRYGMGIARRLGQHGLRVLGVDFNPEVIRSLGAGADLVFLPFQDAADQAVDLMLKGEPVERALLEIAAAKEEEQLA
jgi:Kef-type K+ transport system membrane component KefB